MRLFSGVLGSLGPNSKCPLDYITVTNTLEHMQYEETSSVIEQCQSFSTTNAQTPLAKFLKMLSVLNISTALSDSQIIVVQQDKHLVVDPP